jgi:hypothetical protein
MPMSNDLIVLKRVAPKLKEALRWANMVSAEPHEHGYNKIDSKDGQIFFKTLHWSEGRAVMDNIASAGSTYKNHQHSGIEVFIVYKGALFISIDGDTIKIKDVNKGGKPYYINAANEHSGYVKENTEFISITIPGDPDWKPKREK